MCNIIHQKIYYCICKECTENWVVNKYIYSISKFSTKIFYVYIGIIFIIIAEYKCKSKWLYNRGIEQGS